jgi:hypothetical protein
MTVACMESIALRECLAAGSEGIASRFFRAASRLIDTPWQIVAGSDLQHPQVQGKRTAQVRFIKFGARAALLRGRPAATKPPRGSGRAVAMTPHSQR